MCVKNLEIFLKHGIQYSKSGKTEKKIDAQTKQNKTKNSGYNERLNLQKETCTYMQNQIRSQHIDVR